jgi:hypothetical protein
MNAFEAQVNPDAFGPLGRLVCMATHALVEFAAIESGHAHPKRGAD